MEDRREKLTIRQTKGDFGFGKLDFVIWKTGGEFENE
jgi:hypothetical protein